MGIACPDHGPLEEMYLEPGPMGEGDGLLGSDAGVGPAPSLWGS